MNGIELMTAERKRHSMPKSKGGEGWTSEHDDKHVDGELAKAGACYALHAAGVNTDFPKWHNGCCGFWPWAKSWWKPAPKNPIKDLVRAGALIAAEIDRLQRIQSVSSAKSAD